MKIPKQVIVGNTTVKIERLKSLKVGRSACRGSFDHSKKVISVASESPSGDLKFSTGDKANTFWHELTHAILDDMGNKLAYDEKFVSSFSDRLDQAIKTARF